MSIDPNIRLSWENKIDTQLTEGLKTTKSAHLTKQVLEAVINGQQEIDNQLLKQTFSNIKLLLPPTRKEGQAQQEFQKQLRDFCQDVNIAQNQLESYITVAKERMQTKIQELNSTTDIVMKDVETKKRKRVDEIEQQPVLKEANVTLDFEDALKVWVDDTTVQGNTAEASQRIKKAFDSKASVLDLVGLQLTSIPPCIYQLTHLQSLDLWGNRLETIPPEIGNLTNLQELSLPSNQLKAIPPEIGNLTNLKKLYLHSNQLKVIPPEIGTLTHLQLLSLYDNQLKAIPPEIRNLTNLQELNLSENQLKAIPPEIGNLTNLKELNLSNNQLKAIPPEIGTLTSLQELSLSENQLKAIPPEIRNLTTLEKLYLNNNQLTALPVGLGQLFNLNDFDIYDNPTLTELPMSLGNLPKLTHLDISGTGISQSQCDTILAACRALREANAQLIFPLRLNMWFTSGKSSLDPKVFKTLIDASTFKKLFPSRFNQFENDPEALKQAITAANTKAIGTLNEWLLRLETTRDFQGRQETLAKIVCGMLETVINDDAFKETLLIQADANNEYCGDRAAMSLNEIYTSWRMLTLPEKATLSEKIALIRQAAKTIALRRILAGQVNKYQTQYKTIEHESVEILLYYETRLKEKLGLLTAIARMAHSPIGKRNWIDEKALVEKVNATYVDDLITIPAFTKLAESDEGFKKLWDVEKDKYFNEIEALIASKPAGDEYSIDVLDWNIKVNMLKEKALGETKRAWIKPYLNTTL